jgi:ATP-binding cassette, subfamily B, bacterial MsbA
VEQVSNPSAVQVFKNLLPYLLRHKLRLLVAFISMGLVALFSSMALILFKPTLEVLFSPRQTSGITVWMVSSDRAGQVADKVDLYKQVNWAYSSGRIGDTTHSITASIAGDNERECEAIARSIADSLNLDAPRMLPNMHNGAGHGKVRSVSRDTDLQKTGGFFNSVRNWFNSLRDNISTIKDQLYLHIDQYLEKQDGHYRMLIAVVGFLVLLMGLKGVFTYIQDYLMNWVGNRLATDLRDDLFTHICSFSLRRFHRQDVGELMSFISNDVPLLRSASFNVIGKTVQEPMMILGTLVVMIFLDLRLTVITLVTLPVTAYCIAYFGKRVKRARRRAQEFFADINTVQQEAYSGIRVVKAFAMEKYESLRFMKANNKAFRMLMKVTRARAASSPVIEFLGTIAAGMAILAGGYFVFGDDSMEGSDFLVFLIALASLYQPAKRLSKAYNSLMQGIVGGERIFGLLQSAPEVLDKPDAKVLPGFSKDIVFDHVNFAYVDNRPVLRDTCLEVKKGEVIALVGPSGAGKSTLVNMLMRMFDPDSGGIRIDGTDLRDVTQSSLRKQIGIVPQETILFNDTLGNNIAYGSSEISREQAISAAKDAYAHDFIMDMPDNYETEVGGRGATLSGGQAQRVSIARALAKNPPILIFDEATSSLDSESENLIRQALQRLLHDRTTFLIAHRLSTIVHADRIVVMEEGGIVDVGNHEELIERCALYARLCKLQHIDRNAGNSE